MIDTDRDALGLVGASWDAVYLLDGAARRTLPHVRARPAPAGSDVPIRWRILYRFMTGGHRDGPGAHQHRGVGWSMGDVALSYTTTWTWTPWIDAMHLSGEDETCSRAG